MARATKHDFDESSPIMDEEDAATLAAIDRSIKAADEGRSISLEEVRQRISQWPTQSPSPSPSTTTR